MKLTVNSQNKYTYYPDIENNLELEERDRFAIIIRKVNQSLASGKWTRFKGDGDVEIDMRSKIRNQVVEILNPPLLKIDGKREQVLTVDILLSDDYSELYPIVNGLVSFITKVETEGGIETKKS